MAKAGAGSGLLEGAYRVLMRRNLVYIAFILTGALVGERVLDYGINNVWEQNNIGVFGGEI
ncbi:hypothetical protein O6H91_03G084000 [Diphasiastrum complanatum]|uniref:Uncharacterized protein n=1 Tax=Diphasiastrum complanatum TaxID=34168 RepID=A0ACC2E821_DIPCM|nr:hypothetical protein O6H91_03G084000 [Diphasiastrum complanatum]